MRCIVKKPARLLQRRARQPQGSSPRGVPVPRLATLRRQKGLSQAELAERADVGTSTISRLERGANAHYATIDLLAAALGATRERLIKPLRRKRRKEPGERGTAPKAGQEGDI
jgi:transcriptional regulator with XRE-family HTH domain